MNRIDVMVDLETLGTEADSVIFQIAAATFDITSGAMGTTFNRIADISKNPSYDMTVSGSTLKWWLNTDKELFANLLNQGRGSSRDLVDDFRDWLNAMTMTWDGELHLWGNGILFDNLFLKHAMGEEYPVRFTHDRDMRTIVDLTMMKTELSYSELKDIHYRKSVKAHDAVNDVMNQIRLVSACYRTLMDNKTEKHDPLKAL